MPPIDSAILALMASVATVFVQMVKGLVPDHLKQWIPLALFVVMTAIGLSVALYYGRDPLTGALEGFFGFASAVGFYEAASSVPGARRAFNSEGWIRPK